MRNTPSDILPVLNDAGEAIDALLLPGDSPSLVLTVAEALHRLWPSAPLCACWLQESSLSLIAVVDETSQRREEWEKSLPPALADRQREKVVDVPASLALPECDLFLCARPVKQDCRLTLAVALLKSEPPQTKAVIPILLALCGRLLASRIQATWQDRELALLRQEMAGQAALAGIGEMVGPVGHAFNNFLNNLLLHIAVLQSQIPESFQGDLAELRRQGTRMAKLVSDLQQYRHQQPLTGQISDLNHVLQAALRALEGKTRETRTGITFQLVTDLTVDMVSDFTGSTIPVLLELAPSPLLVKAAAAELRWLCTILLVNSAAAVASSHGRLTIRTKEHGDKVLLQLEDTGARLAPERLEQFFEPWGISREETNPLELAACQSLVRRLQGTIQARNSAAGGITIFIELPRTQEGESRA